MDITNEVMNITPQFQLKKEKTNKQDNSLAQTCSCEKRNGLMRNKKEKTKNGNKGKQKKKD